MTPEYEKIVNEILDSMPESFWGRLWDDDCICENELNVNPKCINRRCVDLKKTFISQHRYDLRVMDAPAILRGDIIKKCCCCCCH